jgi:hypothetical protein
MWDFITLCSISLFVASKNSNDSHMGGCGMKLDLGQRSREELVIRFFPLSFCGFCGVGLEIGFFIDWDVLCLHGVKF